MGGSESMYQNKLVLPLPSTTTSPIWNYVSWHGEGNGSSLSYGGVTMCGRRAKNEDRVVCCVDDRKSQVGLGLFDGHNGPHVAHHLAHTLVQHLIDDKCCATATDTFLELDASYAAHRPCLRVHTNPLYSQKPESDWKTDDGSTASIVLYDSSSHKMRYIHSGDSRGYHIFPRTHQITQLGHDHKPWMDKEFVRISKAGLKMVECNERIQNPIHANHQLNVSRGFGDFAYKKNSHLSAQEQAVTVVPDETQITLGQDEYVLLCTDGLNQNFSNAELENHLVQELQNATQFGKHSLSSFEMMSLCQKLALCALSSPRESSDNVTILLMKRQTSTTPSHPFLKMFTNHNDHNLFNVKSMTSLPGNMQPFCNLSWNQWIDAYLQCHHHQKVSLSYQLLSSSEEKTPPLSVPKLMYGDMMTLDDFWNTWVQLSFAQTQQMNLYQVGLRVMDRFHNEPSLFVFLNRLAERHSRRPERTVSIWRQEWNRREMENTITCERKFYVPHKKTWMEATEIQIHPCDTQKEGKLPCQHLLAILYYDEFNFLTCEPRVLSGQQIARLGYLEHLSLLKWLPRKQQQQKHHRSDALCILALHAINS